MHGYWDTQNKTHTALFVTFVTCVYIIKEIIVLFLWKIFKFGFFLEFVSVVFLKLCLMVMSIELYSFKPCSFFCILVQSYNVSAAVGRWNWKFFFFWQFFILSNSKLGMVATLLLWFVCNDMTMKMNINLLVF